MTLSVFDLPADYRNIHYLVSRNIPDAVLAGGALRDWLYGLEPKDLDIFVPATSQLELEAKVKNLAVDLMVPIHRNFTGSMSPSINDEVVGCYSFTLFDHEVQIIGLNLPGRETFFTETLDRIDIGLCQIGLGFTSDGTLQIRRTLPQLIDQMNGTMTTVYAPSKETLKRSSRRAERLAAKYPQHIYRVDRTSVRASRRESAAL